MKASGFQVAVATRLGELAETIESAGLEVFDVPFERSLRRPWSDIKTLWALRRVAKQWRPDIIHLVSLKPILLGSAAIRISRHNCSTVFAFTGMGFLFSSSRWLARALRPVVVWLLRRACKVGGDAVIVQNDADARLVSRALLSATAEPVIIAGAGVDISQYRQSPYPRSDQPIVLMPARLLRDKGIYEFAEAARTLKAKGRNARFVLVGMLDQHNHGAVKRADLDRWIDEELLEWWGYRDDMPAIYAQASVVCLPSHQEGFPKALLEAAACARPLVATDIPGCRDICISGRTGLSVTPRDARALATAIEQLLSDVARSERMGVAGRDLVAAEFSIESVSTATLMLYNRLLERTE